MCDLPKAERDRLRGRDEVMEKATHDNGTERHPRAAIGRRADLVDRLRRGEPAAGRTLYAEVGPLVNRLVWRFLGADQEHDDVVQEVFVAVLGSIKKLKDPEMLDQWVASVTVNVVRREIRSRTYRRRVKLVPDSRHEWQGVPVSGEKMAFLRSFYGLLDRVSAGDRITFVLHYMEGYTLPEVAALAGYSLATAKRRIARARSWFEQEVLADPILASHVPGGDYEN